MKKTLSLFTILCLCSLNLVYGQQKIALQSKGKTTIFGTSTAFTDAYNASLDGDTIYLPGGTIPYPATINKRLVIIGAGHYPASTIAIGKTVISGGITISQNADNLILEGIEFTGGIYFTTNHKVDSVIIRRCKFNGINIDGTGTTPCINVKLLQNVICGTVTLTNATSSMLANNIIEGQIYNVNNVGISNNILLFYSNSSYNVFYNVDNCFITNNIVLINSNYNFSSLCELNTFSNNIFAFAPTVGYNTFSNNYNSVSISTVFVEQTGNLFNYAHNYHLGNPTQYLGIDNTQVGIYGGYYPWKEGAVPQNPHIKLQNNAATTDANGNLQIQFQVEAQTN